MFSLLNLYNDVPLVISIKYKDEKLDFTIGPPLIDKRNKDELDPEKQFVLLNSYVNYKGEKFKKELFDRYKNAYNIILAAITRKDLYPLPDRMVHDILDMFDLKDVYNFIKNVYGLKAPSTLADVFDVSKEKDGRVTRAQTFIKEDYLQLAALVNVLKPVLPVLGYFAYVKSSDVSGKHKEYILFNMINNHPIYQSEPMQKVLGMITELVKIPLKKTDVTAVLVLEKQVSKDELANYIMSIIAIQKVMTAVIIKDSTSKNIITRIHNYVTGRLETDTNVSKSIRNKESGNDVDSIGSEDKESVIEAYRIAVDIPDGFVEEMNWYIGNIDYILRDINVTIDINILRDSLDSNRIFLEDDITDEQILVLSFIFKNVIDPRALEYLNIESIINLLSVGFAYLWAIDCKHLAIILTSVLEKYNEDDMTINSTVHRNRITKEIKAELNELFPYEKVINSETTQNNAEIAINKISDQFYDRNRLPTCDIKYVNELGINTNKLIPSNLKIQLANMIIKIERMNKE